MGGLSPCSIGWTAWTACKACEACTGVHCIANVSLSLSLFLSLSLSLYSSLSLHCLERVLILYDFKSHLYKFKSSTGEKGRVNSRRHTSRSDSHESLLIKLLGDLTTVPDVSISS